MAQPTSTRRQLFGAAATAAGTVVAAAVTVATDRARRTSAADPLLADAATVTEPAVRLSVTTTSTTVPSGPPQPRTLRFPLDPEPDCHVLDNFGDCRAGGDRAHAGIDIMTTRGREVYAVRAGRLTGRFDDTGTAGFGWTLTGDDGVVYRYMHLDRFAADLTDVDVEADPPRVVAGQVIGYAGSTGTGSDDNVHLHFEVKIGGRWVDPLPLLVLPPEATVGPRLDDCIGLVNS